MPYLRVALDVPLPTLFDYHVEQAGPGEIGCRVRVPFGRKVVIGIVMAVGDATMIAPDRVRAAGEVLRDMPPLPDDVLELLDFCSTYYHHPVGETVAAALPARFRATAIFQARTRLCVSATALGTEVNSAGVKRAPALARVLARLCAAGLAGTVPLDTMCAGDKRAVKTLIERGWAHAVAETPAALPSINTTRPTLTPEQQAAVASISEEFHRYQPWLLHGITGSGKTEVYLRVMEQVLTSGRQVLLLVPEIGLTPQLEARVRARFSQWRVTTLHSGLSESERALNWLAARTGSAHVVLGTRSAIFVPLPRLGLIVVDEEHDTSYKQIEGMRYSARDLAVWRARQRNVPVVLGSATPSLESYHAATVGRYRMLVLAHRANAAPLPDVRMVAMGEAARGLSTDVLDAIRQRIERHEQVLVFINRRGYAPVLVCGACAWAPSCHRCAARLVLHRVRSRMICHHCGHTEPVPIACTSCGNIDLHPLGYGTQRIEAAIAHAFPSARILRVDRDTTRVKDSWAAMRSQVERGEVDILVGTQLLSKGHDFPGLALVCVLNADQSLYSTDFRASEQLFAQLIQVAGRAGRGRIAGEVLIQTQFPRHPLYLAVQAHDYAGFARTILTERERTRFPPFVYQAVLRAEAQKLADALDFLSEAAQLAGDVTDGVQIFEPTPATMERLKGKERAQLLVQSDRRPLLHEFLSRWSEKLAAMRAFGARWGIDVDPLSV